MRLASNEESDASTAVFSSAEKDELPPEDELRLSDYGREPGTTKDGAGEPCVESPAALPASERSVKLESRCAL
jgi:hypothetical protein